MNRILHIYKITNKINNKIYIGQTVQKPKKRWQQHVKCSEKNSNQIIHRALKYHGIENFEFKLIACCKTFEDANHLETLFVSELKTLIPNGYNLTLGGKNAPKTKKWREEASKSKKGHKNPMFGKPRSDLEKQKMSLAQKGNLHHGFGKPRTETTKNLISKKLKGRIFSDVHKEKLSLNKKKNIERYYGENNPASKLSNDDRIKISCLLNQGISSRKIAKQFNVTKTTILRLKKQNLIS